MSSTLDRLLRPQSIAVVGASADTNKPGGRALRYLAEMGFKGRLTPVTPRVGAIQGMPTVPSLLSMDDAPDLVLTAIPASRTLEVVRQAADVGAGSLVVTASGFAEAGPAGAALEAEILNTARDAGLRLLGPNCQGVANFATGAVASFSSIFASVPPADGPVAVISQSGSMSVVPYSLLRERGIGVRYSVSTGNESDVRLGEVVRAVIADADIRLVLIYAETLRDAGELAEAAALARARDLPLVAMVAGASPAGARTIRSHTAGLSAPDDVLGAFLARHGIQRVRTMREMVDTAELYLSGRRPRRSSLLVITDSGATAALAADSAFRHGIELAHLGEDATRRLREVLPDYANPANPLDMTATLRTQPTLLRRSLEVLAEECQPDLVLAGFPSSGEGYDTVKLARDIREFADSSDAAVAVVVPQESVARPFRAERLAVFREEDDAVRALRQLADHAILMRSGTLPQWGPAVEAELPESGEIFLDEAQSLRLLAAAGVPTVRHRVCTSLEDALLVLADFGSVVLKVCSARFPHKSDVGLVRLGITSPESLVEAWDGLAKTSADLGVADAAILVAAMQPGTAELFIGARNDPTFGTVTVIGAGGVLAEHLADRVLLVAPFTEEEALVEIKKLRSAPQWLGLRGRKALDLLAVARIAVQVARLAQSHRGTVDSIDVNPVLVTVDGAVAVDASVQRVVSEDLG